jgi:hypothetical protein
VPSCWISSSVLVELRPGLTPGAQIRNCVRQPGGQQRRPSAAAGPELASSTCVPPACPSFCAPVKLHFICKRAVEAALGNYIDQLKINHADRCISLKMEAVAMNRCTLASSSPRMQAGSVAGGPHPCLEWQVRACECLIARSPCAEAQHRCYRLLDRAALLPLQVSEPLLPPSGGSGRRSSCRCTAPPR